MTSLREELARAFVESLRAIDLPRRVRVALAPLACGASRVRIVAIGKAAPAMMLGALAVTRGRVDRALAVMPDGTDASMLPSHVAVLRADHPVPDARSELAATRALEAARGLSMDDVFVALVSGGASSLACAPLGVSLARKADIVRTMLASGAPIEALNVVRRHLSRIKGGGLARAAAPAWVIAILASDVIGGAPHDIGSGPAVYDPTTRRDAEAAFARWASGDAPSFADTVAPSSCTAARTLVRVVASPNDLAAAVAARLGARVLLPRAGTVQSFVDEYAALARRLAPGEGVVRAAEPTLAVTARAPGRGGRCSHLAAALAPCLPPGIAFLAGASDGVDGTSGAAGAVVDGSFVSVASEARLAEALASFDTAALHESAGTRIVLPPTGQNLTDVHALARAK